MLNLIPSDMGNRIHIQIKREIEYGDYGFNWQIEELMSLLSDSGCEICGSLNDDCVGDWEIPEEQFREAVENIANKSAMEVMSYFDNDFVGRIPAEEFKDDVVSTLRRFEQTGDHRSGFYHFSWF